MLLKEKINKDFMEAFKNKEMDKKNFLGLLKGEIQNESSNACTWVPLFSRSSRGKESD